MRLPPISAIAAWPAPNYVNPETRGPANTIILSILLAIVTGLLAIRFYTRARISNGFGVDDILILIAFIPATAFAVTGGIIAPYTLGWNRHIWDLPLNLAAPGLQLSLATQLLFDIATSLTKLSMLALLYRLAVATSSLMRYTVLIFGAMIAVDCLIFVFVTMLQCQPVSDYWTLSLEPQHCINEGAHLLAAGIINTVSDFIIVLLPISTVAKLQLPTRQRLLVYLLFAGGLLATTAGAVRTYLTWVMTSGGDYDITWHSGRVILSSSIELYVGIICASIPATKPFFTRYIPRLLGLHSSAEADEPLSKHMWASDMSKRGSFSTFHDIESPQTPPRAYGSSHTRRTITEADLNKPLPKIRETLEKSLMLSRTSREIPIGIQGN